MRREREREREREGEREREREGERERESNFVLKKKKHIESIQASTMVADRICAVVTLYPCTDDNSELPSFTEHYIPSQ